VPSGLPRISSRNADRDPVGSDRVRSCAGRAAVGLDPGGRRLQAVVDKLLPASMFCGARLPRAALSRLIQGQSSVSLVTRPGDGIVAVALAQRLLEHIGPLRARW